jgi:hypothetical protein
MTGQQAISILRSDELKEFRVKQGEKIPILVEGRVGLIESNGDPSAYLEALKQAGATGAIVGGGLVPNETGHATLESLLKQLAK